MSDQFVAEIRIVGWNFAQTGWAFCDGALLPISQNTALFSLLGTNYGGNGINNFALPNLQGRFPMGVGNGPGLTPRVVGESGGTETVTLLPNQIPAHVHGMQAASQVSSAAPVTGTPTASIAKPYHPGPADVTLGGGVVSPAGAGLPHNNLPPFVAMNFVIALQGIFPPRG